MALGTAALVVGGLSLVVWFGPFGVAVFSVLYTLGWQITWSSANPIAMRAIELEGRNESETYRYLSDRELFLSLGRLIGIGRFLLLYWWGATFALRVTPLLLAGTQLLVLRSGARVAKDETL